MLKMLPILLLLSGCGETIKYVKVSYPVPACSPPPVIVPPELYIKQLNDTDRSNPGKVVKYYDVTLQQLTDYNKQLLMVLEQYQRSSITFEKLSEQFDDIKIETKESE